MVSRRSFLGAVATLAAAGSGVRSAHAAAQGALSQFMVSAPACTDKATLTPAAPDDAGFRPGAPRRQRLSEPGTAGAPLVVSGGVSGLTCGRIKGARVDFWQADAAGVIDRSGFRLRGHQLTAEDGSYSITTVVPCASGGRAPHLSARIEVPGKATLVTELFLPDDPANARDPRFKQALVMLPRASSTGRVLSFDFILDL